LDAEQLGLGQGGSPLALLLALEGWAARLGWATQFQAHLGAVRAAACRGALRLRRRRLHGSDGGGGDGGGGEGGGGTRGSGLGDGGLGGGGLGGGGLGGGGLGGGEARGGAAATRALLQRWRH